MNENEAIPTACDQSSSPWKNPLSNRLEPLLPPTLECAYFPPLPSQPSQISIPRSLVESNPWKGPNPLLSRSGKKKFVLRFISPSIRGSDEVGVCSSDAVAPELQILDNTLVGFFLGKRPGFTFVRNALLKQWRLSGSVEVLQLLHGGIAFRFSCISDRDFIVDKGMFYVGGQPIFLQPWERNMHTGSILGLKKIPLWVSLPGLPLHLWGEDSLSVVCSVLGKPLFTDQITASKCRWAFARACVEFSGNKPLIDTVMIEDDEGNLFHQPVQYSWKPPQCLSCGTFGHGLDACKLTPAGNESTAINPAVLSAVHEDGALPERSIGGWPPSSSPVLVKGLQAPSLLQGWSFHPRIGRLPSRVRTKGSGQTRDPSNLPGSDIRQSSGHVSCLPSSTPVLSPKPKMTSVDQPLSHLNSNFSAPTQSVVPIHNMFEFLDSSKDQSEPHLPSSNPDCPSSELGSPFDAPFDGMSPLDPLDPNPPLDRVNLSRSSSPGTGFPETRPLISPRPSGISPYSPSNRTMTGPTPSSAGHTPFPSSSTLNLSNSSSILGTAITPFSGSKSKSFPMHVRLPMQLAARSITYNGLDALMVPTCMKNVEEGPDSTAKDDEEETEEEEDGIEEKDDADDTEEEVDQRGRENEEEDAALRVRHGRSGPLLVVAGPVQTDPPHASPIYGLTPPNLKLGLSMPAPKLTTDVATAEDVEEEDEEEAGGIEEDDDEDDAEEDDDEHGREVKEEDAPKRKVSTDYGKYGDHFLQTTDRGDPRRIRFC